ncbi:MAG: type II toxin-antitoxin system mRNA interferase toxin, RelE/StbE family [Patescibacteria group bacterium]
MYKLKLSKGFKKDFKKIKRNPRFNSEKLKDVFDSLINNHELDKRHSNHKLIGDLSDYYECHLAPDILLIYRINKDDNFINIDRIGSHSELFN